MGKISSQFQVRILFFFHTFQSTRTPMTSFYTKCHCEFDPDFLVLLQLIKCYIIIPGNGLRKTTEISSLIFLVVILLYYSIERGSAIPNRISVKGKWLLLDSSISSQKLNMLLLHGLLKQLLPGAPHCTSSKGLHAAGQMQIQSCRFQLFFLQLQLLVN